MDGQNGVQGNGKGSKCSDELINYLNDYICLTHGGMIQKYFPFDKNYLLEKAQLSIEKESVIYLINHCKEYYLQTNNPLGLVDDTVAQIQEHETVYKKDLREFYRQLCGIYRYRHGDNQLELLFDGSDHLAKYEADWRNTYRQWLNELVTSPLFVRAILELSVFHPGGRKGQLATNRLKIYIEQHFGIKFYRYRGIVESEAA